MGYIERWTLSFFYIINYCYKDGNISVYAF